MPRRQFELCADCVPCYLSPQEEAVAKEQLNALKDRIQSKWEPPKQIFQVADVSKRCQTVIRDSTGFQEIQQILKEFVQFSVGMCCDVPSGQRTLCGQDRYPNVAETFRNLEAHCHFTRITTKL